MSCGQPVAPMLAGKIKQVEWENLNPEKYPELFKAVVAKMFPPARASEEKTYLSEAVLSSKREQVRAGHIMFRRAKLDLTGHVVLPSTYAPTKDAIAFQIVQFGFNVTDPANPDTRMRCEQNAGRVMPDDHQFRARLFIASENLREFYSEMTDLQNGFGNSSYHNLWLINGQPYGELYDDKGTVLLSEARSANFVRACLFGYKDSDK